MEKKDKKIKYDKPTIWLIVVVALLVIFNQWQVNAISKSLGGVSIMSKLRIGSSSGKDISNVNIDELKSTGHSVAALFPVEDIKTAEDAVSIMVPTGTPDYGQAMGVSFDDPVGSMEAMARAYPALKQQAQQNSEVWQRYLNLASKPVGISCEFCCGVGNIGIDRNGNLLCGCQHLPAIHTVTLW